MVRVSVVPQSHYILSAGPQEASVGWSAESEWELSSEVITMITSFPLLTLDVLQCSCPGNSTSMALFSFAWDALALLEGVLSRAPHSVLSVIQFGKTFSEWDASCQRNRGAAVGCAFERAFRQHPKPICEWKRSKGQYKHKIKRAWGCLPLQVSLQFLIMSYTRRTMRYSNISMPNISPTPKELGTCWVSISVGRIRPSFISPFTFLDKLIFNILEPTQPSPQLPFSCGTSFVLAASVIWYKHKIERAQMYVPLSECSGSTWPPQRIDSRQTKEGRVLGVP